MSEQDKMLERARLFCEHNHIHNGSVNGLARKFRAIRREALEEAAAASCPYCRKVEAYGYPHVDKEGYDMPCFAPRIRARSKREEENRNV